MNKSWLLQVLAEYSHLNLEHPDGRDRMSEEIFAAMPKDVIVAAIRESTTAVLEQRGLLAAPDSSPGPREVLAEDLVREIANNATQTVLLMLYVGAEDQAELELVPETVEQAAAPAE